MNDSYTIEANLYETLTKAGWLISPPGTVPVPLSLDQAEMMVRVGMRYLEDNKEYDD